MDTSKKYIKMCEKAKEIRKHWCRRVGDFYCGYKNVMIATGAGREDGGLILLTNTIYVKTTHVINKGIIWLPRQDQLQEMVCKTKDDCYRLYIDACWMDNNWEKFDTMEQHWLACVMKEKYSKIWDGTKWGANNANNTK